MRNILRSIRIKNMLFSKNGDTLSTVFNLSPNRLERTLSTMEFNNGNYNLVYEHDAIRDMQLKWPIENSLIIQESSFKLFDIKGNKSIELSTKGDWSLFKLIDKLKVKSASTNMIEVYYENENDFASIYLKGKISDLYNEDKLFDNFSLNGEI